MSTVHTMVLILHVIVGAMIIGLVLLQRGKGAETGAAFGAGASATVFGAKGSANFLSRSTAVLATVFFATSLSLAYLGSQRPVEKSIVDQGGAVTDTGAATGTDGQQRPAQPVLPGEEPAGDAAPGAQTPVPATAP